ncbi:hypothetical protein GCM10009540_16050 [Streptomyces turgidiscabies]
MGADDRDHRVGGAGKVAAAVGQLSRRADIALRAEVSGRVEPVHGDLPRVNGPVPSAATREPPALRTLVAAR